MLTPRLESSPRRPHISHQVSVVINWCVTEQCEDSTERTFLLTSGPQCLWIQVMFACNRRWWYVYFMLIVVGWNVW